MDDYKDVCEPCVEGEHERCYGGGCMCIDMEHDDDEAEELFPYTS